MRSLPLLLVAAFLTACVLPAEAQTRKKTSSPATASKGSESTVSKTEDKKAQETEDPSAEKGESQTSKSRNSAKPADKEREPPKEEKAEKTGDGSSKADWKNQPSAKASGKQTNKPSTARSTSKPAAIGRVNANAEPKSPPIPNASSQERPRNFANGEPPPATVKPPLDNAGEDVLQKTRKIGPNITLYPDDLAEFDQNPPAVKRLLQLGLELTKLGLTYRYGSSDPANGGMDCSGTIYYLLKQAGIKDPPRDSSGLYLWAEKQGTLRRVNPASLDDAAFDDLKPGDLLFWEGTYELQRDPPISHTMIYLGREKQTGIRVMVGASDGRVYNGTSRNGVSVFDFKLPRAESTAKFVGYARVPGFDRPDSKGSAVTP